MGFKIDRFIGDVDEEFICPICSGVLEDPLQATDCEHAFCRACITEWISCQPTCPVDRQPVTASQLRPVQRLIRNVLSRLCTSCDYAPHGCNAVLKLESLASHLVECEFNPKTPVPCEAGCGLVIPKDELADHNCVRELRALFATQQKKLNDYEQELAENKIAHQEKLNDYERELAEHKRAQQEKMNDYEQELAKHKRAHQEKLNDYEQELAEHKRAHHEKWNDYKQELAEHKRAHQEKLNDYKQELAEHKRAHQEKLNDYKQELAEHKTAHQEKLNDYEQESAEHKRAHHEKLNDYDQEIAELKRDLAVLKEFKQLVEQREREEVVCWSNTLEHASVPRGYALYHTPNNYLKMRIKGSLTESGCPPHILDDLMKNCEVGRWPPSIRSWYEGGTLSDSLENANYVSKRVPGQRALLFLHCDNTNVDQQDMMVKPGFIMIFQYGGFE